jgi:hypothetical protein
MHFERTQQVAGLTEPCQDERLTRGQLFTQGGSRAQSVDTRKVGRRLSTHHEHLRQCRPGGATRQETCVIGWR